jgi:peroxiredoxin
LELLNDEIEAAGLRTVAIGIGQTKHAQQFGDKLAPSIVCLTNEEPVLHETFGIGNGNMLQLVSPGALKAGARAASKGFTQGKATGDQTRLTGTFIVDQTGTIRTAYYGRHAGDHADVPAMLADWKAQHNSQTARA